MPKISQLSDKYATEALLREIRTRQGAADLMNIRSLADACGVPYQTLLRRLKHPEDFTLGELKKLIKTLPLHPFAILYFLGYGKKEINSIFKENQNVQH